MSQPPAAEDVAPLLERVPVLLEEENEASLRALLESVPKDQLVKLYKQYVQRPKRTASERAQRAILIFNRSHDRVRGEDLIENLDRLREREPRFLMELAELWVKYNSNDLSALADGTIEPEAASPQLLIAAQPLLPAASAGLQRSLIARLAGAEEGLREAEAGRASLREEVARREADLERAKAQAEALREELEVERRARARDADAFGTRLSEQREASVSDVQRAVGEERKARLESRQRELDALAAQQGKALEARAALEAEKATRVAEREEHREELREREAALRDAHQAELERLGRDYGLDRAALDRTTDELEALGKAHGALEGEHARLKAGVEEARRELQHARARAADLARAFESALVVSYARLARDPAERLAELFTLYGAFLEHDHRHEGLARHTNIADFADREPEGIVVTDMERLLRDGAELALVPLLRMKVLRQESVLKGLRSRLAPGEQEH